jgi:hypothetical protein
MHVRAQVKHIPITPQLTTADVVKIVINDVSLPQTYAAGTRASAQYPARTTKL